MVLFAPADRFHNYKFCRDFKMYFRRSYANNKLPLRRMNADCDQVFLVCSLVHCVFIALGFSLTESKKMYFTHRLLMIYSMIFGHLHLCIWKMKLLTLLLLILLTYTNPSFSSQNPSCYVGKTTIIESNIPHLIFFR